jgi:hypothetical protein
MPSAEPTLSWPVPGSATNTPPTAIAGRVMDTLSVTRSPGAITGLSALTAMLALALPP